MLEWMKWIVGSFAVILFMFVLLFILAVRDYKHKSSPRKGFLRFETTLGDRIFLSLIIAVIVGLFWVVFIPQPMFWLSIFPASAIGFIITIYG